MSKCYKYYNDEHYSSAQKQSKKKAKSQRNYIFSTVEDGLALLTDNQPSLDCWPRTREDIQVSEKAKQVLDWIWETTESGDKLEMVLRDVLISGVGFLKVYFDSEINYPYGEVAVDVVHPDYIYPDPDATSMDNLKYIIQATPTPLWVIRNGYKNGKYVKADDTLGIEPEDDGTVKNATYNHEGEGQYDDARHQRAWLYEVWVTERATFKDEELEGESDKKEEKYPKGRKIVVAGDILLEDSDCPFTDGHPFIMFENYRQSNSFWAHGDVEYLVEINNDINKIVSRLNDYIRMTAHTYITYDAECGIDPKSLENVEGVLVKKNKGGDFNVNPPPTFPAAVFDWLQTCKSDLEIIHGIREVLVGRSDDSTSGVAINRLQEFALARIRKKARTIDKSILRLGRKYLARVKQYYDPARQIRITGDFPIEQVGPDGMPVQQGFRQYDFIDISSQDFQIPDETGNVREVELDVVLEVGLAASTTRERDRQDALLLFDKGILDEEEVAKRYDIKNFQEIQTRKQQKLLEMEQMKAQVAAQAQTEAMIQAQQTELNKMQFPNQPPTGGF